MANAHAAAGARALRAGCLNHAQTAFEQAIAQHPGCHEALHGLGWLAWKRGHEAAAGDYLCQAGQTAEGARDPVVHADLGVLHMRRGDVVRSRVEFAEAVTFAPEHEGAMLGLSAANFGLGNRVAAVACFLGARLLRPHLTASREHWRAARFDDMLALCPHSAASPEAQVALNPLGNHEPWFFSLQLGLWHVATNAPALASVPLRLALAQRPDSTVAARAFEMVSDVLHRRVVRLPHWSTPLAGSLASAAAHPAPDVVQPPSFVVTPMLSPVPQLVGSADVTASSTEVNTPSSIAPPPDPVEFQAKRGLGKRRRALRTTPIDRAIETAARASAPRKRAKPDAETGPSTRPSRGARGAKSPTKSTAEP